MDDNQHDKGTTQTGVRELSDGGRKGEHSLLVENGRSVQRLSRTTKSEGRGDTNGERTDRMEQRVSVSNRSGSETAQHGRSETPRTDEGGRIPERRDGVERHAGEPNLSNGMGQRGTEPSQPNNEPSVKRGLNTEKVPYKKQSNNPFTLNSLMPAEQADEIKKILEELGDIVRPYIKATYFAVRDYPDMKDIAKEMLSTDKINAFDPYSFDKEETKTVNDNKKRTTEQEKVYLYSRKETFSLNN